MQLSWVERDQGRKVGEENAELEHGRSTNTVTEGGREVLDRLGA